MRHSFENFNFVETISGGDINHAAKLERDGQYYFVKWNTYQHGLEMLQAEADALIQMLKAGVRVPEVASVGREGAQAYLILEWLEQSRTSGSGGLADSLKCLYSLKSDHFGYSGPSFLGDFCFESLKEVYWPTYFVTDRLGPLLSICVKNDLLDAKYLDTDKLIERLTVKTPHCVPTYIHGDLWRGNILVSTSGLYLIDPASFYGHPDVDFAMMDLFGGFDSEIFQVYEEITGISDDQLDMRLAMYQSYFLLFHLQKFGRGYHRQTVQSLDLILC